MNNKNFLVSVLIPCFNEEKNLIRSIESIINQTYSNLEIIIVDNKSTDSSINIIKSFMNIDTRIKLIENSQNYGLTKSLNIGISYIKGEFLCRMDADDYSDPYRIEKQVNEFIKNENLLLCGSWCITKFPNKTVEVRTPTNDIDIKKKFKKDNPIIHSSVMIRISKIGSINDIYYNNVKGFEDYDLWLRLIKSGEFYIVPEFLVTRYDYDNYLHKDTWRGISKSYIYSKRLKYQLRAMKLLGLSIIDFIYISKTLVSFVWSYMKEVIRFEK